MNLLPFQVGTLGPAERGLINGIGRIVLVGVTVGHAKAFPENNVGFSLPDGVIDLHHGGSPNLALGMNTT